MVSAELPRFRQQGVVVTTLAVLLVLVLVMSLGSISALGRVPERIKIIVGEKPLVPADLPHVVVEAIRTEVILSRLEKEAGFPVSLPTYLPDGTRVTGATVTKLASHYTTAVVEYRAPTDMGDVGIVYRQDQFNHGANLHISPEKVLDRPGIGAYEGVLYSSGTPEGGLPLLILAWTDGESIYEVWSGLPAEELIEIARSVAIA